MIKKMTHLSIKFYLQLLHLCQPIICLWENVNEEKMIQIAKQRVQKFEKNTYEHQN